jgi:Rps23 Pro-64 3,4-dihydroxylase Tpa1-like proline 4-hydroxylase
VNRAELSELILSRLTPHEDTLTRDFSTPGRIRSCVIDDLLPAEVAREIYDSFPSPSQMMLKKSLREYKYVAAQLNRFAPILEEATFAFQDPRLLALLSRVTDISGLLADPRLYAGGISMMDRGQFLNPHIDNSHDAERRNYRVLNLLYYVTPDWTEEYGGNLELWDRGLDHPPRTVISRFNRLVLMLTSRSSWHSVSPIVHEGRRCCVSNYYFSPRNVENVPDYYHVTAFRGRPEQPVRDLVLKTDNLVRHAVRKLLPGAFANPHIYRK